MSRKHVEKDVKFNTSVYSRRVKGERLLKETFESLIRI